MSNEIDELMSRIDEYCQGQRGFDQKDIDAVIAYQRKYRAQLETAAKQGKKGRFVAKPEAKIDLSSLGLKAKPAPTELKRRV